jgi:transcriptional regulator with XRE-family HTH domain
MKQLSQKETSQRLGRRIVALREKNKLSQTDLCYEAEVDLSTLSRLERGKLNVTLATLCKISSVLKVNVKDLFD